MNNQTSDTLYHLFLVAVICSVSGFAIANLCGDSGSHVAALFTFFFGVVATLLLIGVGTVTLAMALRSLYRGAAR